MTCFRKSAIPDDRDVGNAVDSEMVCSLPQLFPFSESSENYHIQSSDMKKKLSSLEHTLNVKRRLIFMVACDRRPLACFIMHLQADTFLVLSISLFWLEKQKEVRVSIDS
jgi:hypothetical protein